MKMRSSGRTLMYLVRYGICQKGGTNVHNKNLNSCLMRTCVCTPVPLFQRFIRLYSTSNKPSESENVEGKTGEGRTEDEDRDEQKRKDEEERREKYRKKYTVNTALITYGYFEDVKQKNRDAFLQSIDMFKARDKYARGHVEFIQAALKYMKEFGVHKDLDAYKKLIDVFPKGKMVAQSLWQVEFMHYPKQQFCAIEILEQMEDNGVIGDGEVEDMLTNIFGARSFPNRKHGRMMYWLPKFRHLSPWPLPDPLPDDGLELCKLAIQRITSVDLQTKITIYNAGDLEDALDHTWIVSGQSPTQQKLIENHPSNQPIYVEGAFRVWLKDQCVNYFILRAEPKRKPKVEEQDPDDVGVLESNITASEELNVIPLPSVHEQDDGVILAVCATGSSSKDSLVSWISFLQDTNPRLGKDISVLFTLKSPIGPTDNLDVLNEQETEDKQALKNDDAAMVGPGLGFDPKNPDLSQVGIWKLSDTRFVNWPHHFNRTQEYYREEPLEELERKERQAEIGSKVDSNHPNPSKSKS